MPNEQDFLKETTFYIAQVLNQEKESSVPVTAETSQGVGNSEKEAYMSQNPVVMEFLDLVSPSLLKLFQGFEETGSLPKETIQFKVESDTKSFNIRYLKSVFVNHVNSTTYPLMKPILTITKNRLSSKP